MLKISTAPHLNSPLSTQGIMAHVIIAMLPALLIALLVFGMAALEVVVTSVAGCVLFEYLICRYLLHEKSSTYDLSAVVTGLLLAFNLPAGMPVWMTLLGCFMAIGVSKMAFGGIGKNLFNPALVGRVFLFISFPVQMTTWIKPRFLDFMNSDVETGATTLGILKHIDAGTSATQLADDAGFHQLPDYLQMFVGYTGGCIGEISTVALLIGLFYMLWKRIITWQIPFYFIASFFLLTSVHWLLTDSIRFEPLTHILSGGLMLGAIFMATDYTTSPMSPSGKVIFGIGCGVLTYVIRFYSVYPEGVSFAILIMNAFVPLLDKICIPRVFGTGRRK